MLAIIDYEAGNQTSVQRALRGLGIPAVITADAATICEAKGVIFPGVGAAPQAMRLLERTGMDRVLKQVAAEGRPLLGVCLGCQILLEHSEEGDTQGLGLMRGNCVRFGKDLRDEAGELIGIPHMGWNGYRLRKESRLFEGIGTDAEFYFVHSYYVLPEEDLILAETHHGLTFCSVYGREGLWGVQFHPEKSGRPGLRLLENFYAYCREQG